jgi:hypothetical protein
MSKKKPLPEIARCACGKKGKLWCVSATKSIECSSRRCWVGPPRRTERGAIIAWNKGMKGGSSLWLPSVTTRPK